MKNIKKTIVFFPVILSLSVALNITKKTYAIETQTKSYVEELEEAFITKIASDRATKKLDSNISENIIKKAKKESGVTLPGDENAIGKEVVNYLKVSIKNPLLDFLSSSELTEWATVKARYENSKKALEIFGAKYKTELEAGKQITMTTQHTITTQTMPISPMGAHPTMPTTSPNVPRLNTAAPMAAIPTAMATATSKPIAPAMAAPQQPLMPGPDEEIVEEIVEVDEQGNEIAPTTPAPTPMPGIKPSSSMPMATPTMMTPKATAPTMTTPPTMPITATATAPTAMSPMTARPTMPVAVAPTTTIPTAPKVQYSIPAPKPATPMGGMPMAK
ncbi:MAG: hypothetical protein ABH827_04430 [bacterium]